MAYYKYYKIDEKKFARLRKEAQQFQDDIVCAVGTDFMRNIAEAENRMIMDILKGIETESTADVVEVVRCEKCKHYELYEHIEDFDGKCTLSGIEFDKDFYCGYGERRTDNDL